MNLSATTIALFRKDAIKAQGRYGALGFSLESRNNDVPRDVTQ